MSAAHLAEFTIVSKNTFLELASADEPSCRPRALSEVVIPCRSFSDDASDVKVVSPSASKPKLLWCDSDDDTAPVRSICSGISSRTTCTSRTSAHQSDGAESVFEVCTSRTSAHQSHGAESVFKLCEEGARHGRAKAAKSVSGASLVLRNLPETLTRGDLLATLAEHGQLTAVRFLYLPMYLPIDAASATTLGYAFLTLASVEASEAFRLGMQGAELGAGRKLRISWNLSCGTVADQVNRFRDSGLMHPSVSDEFRPILLQGGNRVQFPAPTKTIRAPRQRDHQRLVARTRKQQHTHTSEADA